MNIYEKLSKIQLELKAPKNQRNTFGKYNFRSAEDILEAVKPICAKHNTTLVLSDEIKMFGDRVYVEASAILYDFEDNKIVVTASAREALTQKGMNDAQITGSSSSYARKYAMNGLFDIDDTKDDDATNKHGKDTQPTKTPYKKPHKKEEPALTKKIMISDYQKKQIDGLVEEGRIQLNGLLSYYSVNSLDGLSFSQAQQAIDKKMKEGK